MASKESFFAQNLKTLRKLNALTQSELANALQIKRNKISSYESGFAQPNLKLLLAIANYFSVSIASLLAPSLLGSSEATNLNRSKADATPDMIRVINEFLLRTQEGQKIYDGLIQYRLLANQNDSIKKDSHSDKHLDLLQYQLNINWKLINSLAVDQPKKVAHES